MTYTKTTWVDDDSPAITAERLNKIEDGIETADTTATHSNRAVLDGTTASFTDADHSKLDGIEAGATADQTGAEIKTLYEAELDTNAFTDADHSKLDGIEAGATADQTGAEIKTLYEAELDTNAFTDADHSKLDGIEAGATANSTDATLLARAHHTGTQTASTISDFDTAVAAAETSHADVVVDSDIGVTVQAHSAVLDATTASFLIADESKLDGIEAGADVTDATNVAAAGAVMESDTTTALMSFVIDEDTMVSNLDTKIPTQQSVKTYVDGVVSSSVNHQGGYNAATNTPNLDTSPSGVSRGDMYTVTVAGDFFATGVEIGDVLISGADNATLEIDWAIVNKNLDAAPIKVAYESNADTNAFTDTEKTNLGTLTDNSVADTLHRHKSLTDAILAAIDKVVASVNAVDVFIYDTSKDSDGGAWRKRCQNLSWYNETLNTATRGATREFPPVALIVAEGAKVTIYDATDSSVPMWMVFNGSGTNMLFSSSTITSVECLNGIVLTGQSTGQGGNLINFLTDDRSFLYRELADTYVYNGNISQRNASLGHSVQASRSTTIVNSSINNVALTVLPNAPIDPATGLPKVTWAVATAGGVSVYDVNADAVYDVTTTGPALNVQIDNGRLYLTTGYALYVFDSIPTADTTTASVDYPYTVANGKLEENISGLAILDEGDIVAGGAGHLSTLTTSASSPSPVSIELVGTGGTIDWGDGSSATFVSDTPVTRTYTLVNGNSINIHPDDNTALTQFLCYNNQLTGSIPDFSSNTALTLFYCYNNQLTGSIPDLSSNTALTRLYCNANQLTGSIPDLSSNTALTYFYCYTNQLTGSIPSLSSNGGMDQFRCDSNQLTGSIPDLSSNTALTQIHCQYNQLTGFAGGTVSATLLNFQAQYNLLTEAAVDSILAAFVAAGASNGTLNLGGTGNATPSATGLTDKATLQGRGWTVTTN